MTISSLHFESRRNQIFEALAPLSTRSVILRSSPEQARSFTINDLLRWRVLHPGRHVYTEAHSDPPRTTTLVSRLLIVKVSASEGSVTYTHSIRTVSAASRPSLAPRQLQRPCKVRAVAAGADKQQQSKPQNSAQAMEAAEKRWESQV